MRAAWPLWRVRRSPYNRLFSEDYELAEERQHDGRSSAVGSGVSPSSGGGADGDRDEDAGAEGEGGSASAAQTGGRASPTAARRHRRTRHHGLLARVTFAIAGAHRPKTDISQSKTDISQFSPTLASAQRLCGGVPC